MLIEEECGFFLQVFDLVCFFFFRTHRWLSGEQHIEGGWDTLPPLQLAGSRAHCTLLVSGQLVAAQHSHCYLQVSCLSPISCKFIASCILIPSCSNVFNEIQTNSFQIWKYGLYFLVVEYDQKPILAPPFIIFEHIFLAIRWVFHSACCKEMEAGEWIGLALTASHKLLILIIR